MALAGWERLTRMLSPGGEAWGAVHHSLGAAYHDRACGDSSNNINACIEHLEQALTVYDSAKFPEQWARTHNKLASAHMRAMEVEGGDHAQKALAHLQHTLDVYTREAHAEQYARVQMDAGGIYLNRSNLGMPKGDPELARDCYTAALQVLYVCVCV
jgi:hypothetical protein